VLRKGQVLAILFAIASSITLISLIPDAFSQSYSTYLTIDPIPHKIESILRIKNFQDYHQHQNRKQVFSLLFPADPSL